LKFFRYPTKIAFFVAFSLSVLAGLGFDGLLAKLVDRYGRKELIYGGVIAISLIDILYFNVFSLRVLVDADKWLSEPPIVERISGDFSLPYNFRLYSHGTNNLDYDKARDFQVQLGLKNILPRDFNMIYEIPNNREWVVLFLTRQTGLNQARTILDYENKQLLLDEELKKSLALQSVRYLVSDVPLSDSGLKFIEKYPFTKPVDHFFYVATPEGGTQVITIPSEAIYLYEWDNYLPRVYLASDYEVFQADERAVRDYIFSEDFDIFEKVLLEERPTGWGESEKPSGGKADIVEDNQNQITITVDAKGDGLLVLHDTYYPGWKAYVCDAEQRTKDTEQRGECEETEILRANYAFRAVKVPEGEHKVIMEFEPKLWKPGLLISGFALIFLAGGLAIVFTIEFRKARIDKR
jgi:hypothetical protein